MTLNGLFNITDWQETTMKTYSDDEKLNTASIKQTYSGDITGTSEVTYLMSYQKSGNAHFNGFEYLSATIENKECQLVFKHQGTFEQGKATSQFTVIESSDEKWLGRSGTLESGEAGAASYIVK